MTTIGIRVLVVDDSPVVRQVLYDHLLADPAVSEVFTAPDGALALRKLERLDPDVVTLDVEMPGPDGLSVLEQIMRTAPRPVIMLSAFSVSGAARIVRALQLGAVDFVRKPTGGVSRDVEQICEELRQKVRAVARPGRPRTQPRTSKDAPRPPAPLPPPRRRGLSTPEVIAIGASTGGTEAILRTLQPLPASFPAGLVVVQHMPEGFTTSFARRLNELCALRVREAEHHDLIEAGLVLVAPGHSHLGVARGDGVTYVELDRRPKISGHRPSVDALFKSVAAVYDRRAIGVLLTGMGRDGAEGLSLMRGNGALTIAQDSSTSVVFGMPKAAIDLGAVDIIAGLDDIGTILNVEVGE